MTTTGAETTRWDLTQMYSDVDDPRITEDLAAWKASAERFAAFRGRLATALGDALAEHIALSQLGNKIGVFLFLKQSENTGDAAVKAKMAEADRVMAQASGEWLTFFTIELTALEDADIERQAADSDIVRKHLPWIRQVRVRKPHLLAEPVEAALTKRSPFGAGAWAEFADEFESDLRFAWKNGERTLSEMLNLLSVSKDAEERAAALTSIDAGLSGNFAKYSAQTLYMIAGAKEVEDRERKFSHPMHGRNQASMIPDAVVEALHDAVTRIGRPLVRRYYKLKAAHLGMKTLKWSDRNAPMPFAAEERVSWDDALDIVRRAYASFSPTLAALVDKAIAERRIDAPATLGKRNGAFNYSFTIPGGDVLSYVFLNYLGSTRDVMTIAHELGHCVHGMLAGEAQGELMLHAPTPYAETASVFGEMTTFNFLMQRLAESSTLQERLALIMGKLDDIMNTVVRQIGFSNFERRLHGHDGKNLTRLPINKLSDKEQSAVWLDTTYELYGKPGEVFTYENAEHLWSYISHFHRPFYVYGYPFGELLTQSLHAARPRLGDRFEPRYLELLRAGGTKGCVELLAPFGLDPTSATFWEDGIAVSMQKMIEEAEALSAEMGVSVG